MIEGGLGLFVPQELAEQRMASAARTQQVNKATLIDPNAIGCDHCTLKETWSHITSPKMKLSGNTKTADILCIGGSPNYEEDQMGCAIVGKSGKLLRNNIPKRHLDRIAFTNIVKCAPDGERNPTIKEAHACSVYLDADIDSLPLRAIIGLGAVPLHKYFPGAQIMRVHGNRFPVSTKHGPIWYYPILHPSFVLRLADEQNREDSGATPVFQSDLRRFFQQVDKWEKPYIYNIKESDVTIVHSEIEALALIDAMQDPIGVDIEASKLKPYEMDAKLITAAVSDGKTTIAFSCEHPENPTDWGLSVLLHAITTKRWIAHNCAYELVWFCWYFREFIDKFMPFEDSMALGRLYHERNSIVSLKDMEIMHLGINLKSIVPVNAARIMEYPISQVLSYNGLDALGSALLWRKLHKQIDQTNYKRILGSITATADMELDGMPIDLTESLRLKKHWTEKNQKIIQDAGKLYEVRAFESERSTEFNIASPDHVGIALTAYGKLSLPRTGSTSKVSYQTDEAALTPFIDTNPLARAVLESREAAKLVSTYIDPVLSTPNRYIDSRLHGSYTTMLTHPYRLSSQIPNMQNFPQRKHREIKSQVVAEKGCLLVKFDFGQLQIRIEGMLTKDKHLIEILINGADMHAEWRDRILDYYPDYWNRLVEKTGETERDMILKYGRDMIKGDFVFANLFGASVKNVSERTGIPMSIMQQITGEFWQEFRGVLSWIKARRAEYRDTGAIQAITGHVRRGIMFKNEPINAPIQFGEAMIVMDAMNEISALAHKEKDPYLRPRIQVHDDLTFVLPDSAELPNYINTIQKILVKPRFPWIIVPLVVSASIGKNWGKFEEFAEFKGAHHR